MTAGGRAVSARRVRRIGSVVGVFALWTLVTHLELVSPLFLPSPDRVVRRGISMWAEGTLQEHVLASLSRIVKGFTLGSVVGVGLGALVAEFATVRRMVRPVVELLRPLPGLAWVPLAIVWFGIAEAGKIFVIFYGTFYPAFTNTVDGIQRVNPRVVSCARTLGAGPLRVFRAVLLPAAMPSILTGLSIGMGLAFSFLVAAELVAATSGLGWMIGNGRRFFRTDEIVLGMVLIALLGYVFITGIVKLRRYVLRWQGE
ncbi:MAG: ABC transporter permease subunit [Nitriliruptorales bacterium]|nr:ABC transporter permease subunit [Nitriliruptorales bacterium]